MNRGGPERRHYLSRDRAGRERPACGIRNARLGERPAEPPESPEGMRPGDCLRCMTVTKQRWARKRKADARTALRHYLPPEGGKRTVCGMDAARMERRPVETPAGPEEMGEDDCLRCSTAARNRWYRERRPASPTGKRHYLKPGTGEPPGLLCEMPHRGERTRAVTLGEIGAAMRDDCLRCRKRLTEMLNRLRESKKRGPNARVKTGSQPAGLTWMQGRRAISQTRDPNSNGGMNMAENTTQEESRGPDEDQEQAQDNGAEAGAEAGAEGSGEEAGAEGNGGGEGGEGGGEGGGQE